MTSQKIQDMIERVKTFNQVFLLIKTRVYKAREKETILKQDQDWHLPLMLVGMPILGTLSQTIQEKKLIHIRGDKISWHRVLLNKPIILNMLHSLKSRLILTIFQLQRFKIKKLALLSQKLPIPRNLKSKVN